MQNKATGSTPDTVHFLIHFSFTTVPTLRCPLYWLVTGSMGRIGGAGSWQGHWTRRRRRDGEKWCRDKGSLHFKKCMPLMKKEEKYRNKRKSERVKERLGDRNMELVCKWGTGRMGPKEGFTSTLDIKIVPSIFGSCFVLSFLAPMNMQCVLIKCF